MHSYYANFKSLSSRVVHETSRLLKATQKHVLSYCSPFTLSNQMFKAHVYLLNKLDKSKQLQITVLVHSRHS